METAQPLWLAGRDGSVLRRHVPDLLLEHRDGSLVLVDVKPPELAARQAPPADGWYSQKS